MQPILGTEKNWIFQASHLPQGYEDTQLGLRFQVPGQSVIEQKGQAASASLFSFKTHEILYKDEKGKRHNTHGGSHYGCSQQVRSQ